MKIISRNNPPVVPTHFGVAVQSWVPGLFLVVPCDAEGWHEVAHPDGGAGWQAVALQVHDTRHAAERAAALFVLGRE